jgi:hypothetical protein
MWDEAKAMKKNIVRMSMAPQMPWLVLAVLMASVFARPAQAAITSTTTGTFSGGDPGEGLDLYQPAGNYLYALNFGKTTAGSITAGNVTFSQTKVTAPQALPAGVTVTAPGAVDFNDYPSNFFVLEYGNTANDNNLETIMKANSQGFPLTVTLALGALPVGTPYTLQMMFIDDFYASTRLTDIKVDNTTAIAAFNQKATISAAGGYNLTTGGSENETLSKGAVVTVAGTTIGSSLTVVFAQSSGSANGPLVGALTMAVIPEPTSLALLGLGGLLAILNRRR